MKDPALLEWVDGSTLKMRVFPLEPREEKRIIISYTQKLATLYERASYRFPAGHSLGVIGQWPLHVRLRDGAAWNWESPSHPQLETEREDGDLLLRAAAADVKADRDFVLHVQPEHDAVTRDEATPGDAAHFAAFRHEDATYLMLRYRPQLGGLQWQVRRDWVFLFEASADRNPLLARTQADVIRTMLEHAQPGDTFNIITAGARVRVLSDRPQPVTRAALARAEALVNTLLASAADRRRPEPWRMAASIAAQRQQLARRLECLQEALDIEYAQLGDTLTLERVRRDGGAMLADYRRLAEAVVTLGQAPPPSLALGVVRAADRWRRLDPEPATPCHSAAEILLMLGARELAWDYLTTPMVEQTGEPQAWLDLAALLEQHGEWELADRAYAAATAIAPDDARLLWDRARTLQRAGRDAQAREVYRQLAEGRWAEQYDGLKARAIELLREWGEIPRE